MSTLSSGRRYREYRSRRENHPTPEHDPARPQTQRRGRSFLTLFLEFWRLLGAFRFYVIASLVTASMATGLSLVVPLLTKFAIDFVIVPVKPLPEWLRIPQALADDRLGLLIAVGVVTMAIAVVRILVGMWGRFQMTRLVKRVQASLRRRVFDHAVRLPLHRVYSLKSGGVASILREDAGHAAELLFNVLYNPWQAIVQLLGTLVILAIVDWRMLLGALLLLPLVYLSHQTWISRIRPIHRDIRATRTSIDAHATEAFGGMRIVRGFNRQKGEAARFIRGGHFMARQELLAWWWSRAIDILWSLLLPLASTAVLVYGGWRVIEGELTIGSVMMFIAYVLMLMGPLELLAVSATNTQTHLAGFDRVLDLLAEPKEFEGTSGEIRVRRATARGRIAIEHVSFAYPKMDRLRRGVEDEHVGQPVLFDISLEIEPGRTVALVGPSGAGKTTLCNLVARFYDPTQGRITFDGVDLKRIDVASYRRLLGIVEQDVFLFDGTIAENIGYGRRGATLAEIARAAALANAAEFIEPLERGYDTIIGERGVRLSGGQKQRLAIARAILADPKILILDEATSNLDTHSETLIQKSLRSLMRDRTCIVIAHRLSTIRHADQIVVLDAGRIVETGAHESLIAAGGRYAAYLRLQVDGTGKGGPELRDDAQIPMPMRQT